MSNERKAWRHASASQIKNFRRCERKWFWEKIMGFKQPTSPAMELGTAIHSELEAYEKDGTIPTNPIALAGLEYLPHPDEIDPKDVERRLNLAHHEMAVPLIGFIDLVEPGARRITDHKTTSNFKYCQSPEELRHDAQAIIYSTEAAVKYWRNSPDITFRHVYYRTRGRPESRESQVVFGRDELEDAFGTIIDTVNEMHKSSVAEPKDVKPNINACSDYGGCPFQAQCNALGDIKSGSVFSKFGKAKPETTTNGEETDMSGILAALQKRKEAQLADRRQQQTDSPPAAEPVVVKQPEPVQLDKEVKLHTPTPLAKPEPAEIDDTVSVEVNPPDGVPMDEVVTAEPKIGGGKEKGPFFPDGTRVRGLKAAELFPAHPSKGLCQACCPMRSTEFPPDH